MPEPSPHAYKLMNVPPKHKIHQRYESSVEGKGKDNSNYILEKKYEDAAKS